MNLRRLLFLGIAGALLAIAACGDRTAQIEDNEYLLVLKTMDNPFFTAIEDGFEEELAGRGEAIVRAGTSESDVDGQRTQLRSYYPSRSGGGSLRGLVITPSASGQELVPDIKRFRDAGLPVILVDTLIPADVFRTLGTSYNVAIQSDNTGGGRLAADLLVSRLPSGRQTYTILMLEGEQASDTARQRRAGFEQRIGEIHAERGVRFDVIYRVANWRREQALRVASAMVGGTSSPDGIFAANDEMALGAARAYESIGRTPPPIVGFDAIPEALEAARNGRIAGTIAQDPRAMGRRAAQLLLDADATNAQEFVLEPIPVVVCAPECAQQ